MCVNNNSEHLLSTTLNAVHGLTRLILTTLYCKNYHSIHFTEEETNLPYSVYGQKAEILDFKNTNEILI